MKPHAFLGFARARAVRIVCGIDCGEELMHKAQARAAAPTKIGDKVAVARHPAAEGGRRLAGLREVRINPGEQLDFGQHGADCKRTFPQNARGFFLRDETEAVLHSRPTMSEIDAARAVILARAEQLGLSLTDLSKKIGGNQSYLQQFLRRGIPRVLPEDKREALAAILQVTPDALRGSAPGKGGPRPVTPEAVAQTPAEQEALRLLRAMSPDQQAKALGVLRALT